MACLTLVLFAICRPGYSNSPILDKPDLKTVPDTSVDGVFNIKPFHLDIIAPSSGVQFYRNGIIFLSHAKGEEKVPDKHVSFGSIKTFMAPVLDTVPGNYYPFLASSSTVISQRSRNIY